MAKPGLFIVYSLSAAALAVACGDRKPASQSAAEPEPPPATAEAPAAEPATPPADPLIAVGTPAPDFKAEAHDGTTIQMSALKGAPVVLYFYPKDETGG